MTEPLVITRVTHSCHLIQIGGPPALPRSASTWKPSPCTTSSRPFPASAASWRSFRVVQASQGCGTGRPGSGAGRSGRCTLMLSPTRNLAFDSSTSHSLTTADINTGW